MSKNIFLWGLYDFANTPLSIAMGGLFLAQWVIIDNKIDDIWYGLVFTLATIVLLSSPFLGTWSDKAGKRMPFIKWATIGLIITSLLVSLVATSPLDRLPKVVIVLALFFFMQYFYQVSLIFYNALLEKISTQKTRARISGIGQAFGEISWLFGNILLLLFATGVVTFFGHPGREQVFFPATLILIFLGLPMILFLKEEKQKGIRNKIEFGNIYTETIQGLKSLLHENKNVAIFLVSFMLISDALLTASLYFAIYLDQIFKINDAQKVVVLCLLEIVATTSSIIIGRLGDKRSLKKLLMLACINLTLIYLIVALTSSLTVLYVIAIFIGFGYGGFYTASRAMLIKLSPQNKLGEYFGFYSLFQKFASIIGPMLWGIVLLIFKDYGLIRYRVGILSLVVLMLLGTIMLNFVKEEKKPLEVGTI